MSARLVWTTYAINGFGAMLGGAVLPAVIADYGLSPPLAGLFVGLPAIGVIVAGLVGGVLADVLGTQRLLALGMAGLAFSVALTGSAPTISILLIGVCCFGMANGLIEVSGNAIIAATSGERAAPELNRLNFFFGLGALTSPACVAIILSHGLAWRDAYYLATVPSVVLAFACFRHSSPIDSRHGRLDVRTLAPVVRHPSVILIWIGAVLLLAAEQGTTGWISTHMLRRNVLSTESASLALSVYWLAVLAGRLVNTRLRTRATYRAIVAIELAGSIIFVGMTLAANTMVAGLLGLGLVGLFMAGLYPTLMALATRTNSASPGVIVGILVTGVGVGKLCGPALIGFAAGRVGLSTAMNLIPVLLLGAAFVIVIPWKRFAA